MNSTVLAKLVSIQVGRPQKIGQGETAWTTAFFKQPVDGSVVVSNTGLEGDGQADTKHHGGLEKAVLAYSTDHESFWWSELSAKVGPGGFGENLSVAGVDEHSTCIGDQWSIGEVVLEVSQPRQPCWKLGRRWERKDLPKLVVQNGRSGWYFRVIQTGTIQAGAAITLRSRPQPEWTIIRANKVFYGDNANDKKSLANVPTLSEAWRTDLQAKTK